jgi:hypothetical protein
MNTCYFKNKPTNRGGAYQVPRDLVMHKVRWNEGKEKFSQDMNIEQAELQSVGAK